jgi:UDP-N-acetylmuramoyl-L-alanyl-D-glutamate--2,6-diaminopimelate ligase
MTTPDPDILYPMLRNMREDGIEYVVMEASSHALALDKLSPLHFDVGIFTNLSPEHLDFHGTMENYLSAKARLFSQCECGILNFDSDFAEKIAEDAPCRILRCGAVYHEEYNAEEIRSLGARGSSYVLSAPGLRLPVSIPIPGSFSVYNSLLAAVAALTLGVSPKAVRDGLGQLRGVIGRLERVDTGEQDFTVMIDYAHTEEAMRNVLTTVRDLCIRGERIVAVFGCGGDRDQTKRGHMGKVAEELADFSIITSDNQRSEDPKQIILDILKGFKNKEKRKVILDREKAIVYAIATAQPRDVILLIGKGHETYQLCGKEKYPFDERKIVSEAIKMRVAAHTNEDEYEG